MRCDKAHIRRKNRTRRTAEQWCELRHTGAGSFTIVTRGPEPPIQAAAPVATALIGLPGNSEASCAEAVRPRRRMVGSIECSAPGAHADDEIAIGKLGDLHPDRAFAAERHDAVEQLLEQRIGL